MATEPLNLDKTLVDHTYQEVRLTLDDGRVLVYSGRAQVKDGEHDLLKIVDVAFSRPVRLPEGMGWGMQELGERKPEPKAADEETSS